MSPADDDPTRQARPARPRQPAPGGAGGAVPPPGQPPVRTWEEELADRIASLKNWVVMLAVISIAALGVAAYAAVTANNNKSSGDSEVTKSQINRLESRISDLEDNSASDASISQLKSDVSDLSDQVDKLQSEGSNSDSVSASDFQDLQNQVADLSQQVSELQAQSSGQ